MPLTTNGCPLSFSWKPFAVTTALVACGVVAAANRRIKPIVGENFAKRTLVFTSEGTMMGRDVITSALGRQEQMKTVLRLTRHDRR
jgi:hypothetical protein